MEKKPVTVGAKEGLGAAIIGLGLLMIFLPSTVQKIADLDFIGSSAFGILLGATYMFALCFIAAGLAVIIAKFDEDEE